MNHSDLGVQQGVGVDHIRCVGSGLVPIKGFAYGAGSQLVESSVVKLMSNRGGKGVVGNEGNLVPR